jgi:hypothetical protein
MAAENPPPKWATLTAADFGVLLGTLATATADETSTLVHLADLAVDEGVDGCRLFAAGVASAATLASYFGDNWHCPVSDAMASNMWKALSR